MEFCGRLLTKLNPPAISIFPFATGAMAYTVLSAPPGGLNEVSSDPLELSRATWLRGTPFTLVKSPPMNTVCTVPPPPTGMMKPV